MELKYKERGKQKVTNSFEWRYRIVKDSRSVYTIKDVCINSDGSIEFIPNDPIVLEFDFYEELVSTIQELAQIINTPIINIYEDNNESS